MGAGPRRGEDELTRLRSALASPYASERARALSRARYEPGMEQVILAALHDPSDLVRRAAIRALARLGVPGSAAALTEATRDVSPAVRGEAVAALGEVLGGMIARQGED